MPHSSQFFRKILILVTLCVCTPAAANTSVPTTPRDIDVYYYSNTAIELIWPTSSDPDGIASYRVYFSGVLFRELEGPSFFVDTLQTGDVYSMQLSSVDNLGQESRWSPVIQVRTDEFKPPAVVFSEAEADDPVKLNDAGLYTLSASSLNETPVALSNTAIVQTNSHEQIVTPQTQPQIEPNATAFDSLNGQVLEQELHRVPDLLDNLYKYNVNSISDLVTYKKPDGTLMQLFTYWADDRRLHVTERSFPAGEFSSPVDVHNAVTGNSESLEYDSHNTTAIGVAPNGVMFITGNHHVDELNMAKSTTNYDIRSMANMLPAKMVTKSEVNRVTYPSFFTAKGHLYFSYREQEVGQGAPRFRWMINRYDPARDEWTTAVQFNTGINLRLYVSNIAVERDGGSMHIFAIWRDDAAKTGSGVENQRDYMHLYSNDGTTWRIKNSATTVTANRHLWYNNGEKTMPGYTGTELSRSEKIWSSGSDPVPRGAGSASVDTAGRPNGLVKAFDGSLHHHYHNGSRWVSKHLGGWSAQSHEIVSCPGQTGAILSNSGKITYRSLNSADKSHNNPILLASGFTTNDYTISVDKEAIKYGYVSFMLTKNSHFAPGQHGSGNKSNPQSAWIATFHCDNLNSAKAFVR